MDLQLLTDEFLYIGVFLIIGFVIREIIKPLQKLFIPASLVGGVLLLILGPQVLGLLSIGESLEQLPGLMLGPLLTGLLLSATLNTRKVKSYADYSLVSLSLYGLQAGVGLLLGIGLAAIWTNLPQGWGIMGVFAFYNGHGDAAATGAVFQDLGIEQNLGIGMILATLGLIVGVLIGLLFVNIGIRKGWTTFIKDAESRPKSFFGGILPTDAQSPIGFNKVSPMAVNSLALQGSLIMLAMFIGGSVISLMSSIFPAVDNLPWFFYGMLGALILLPILSLTKTEKYKDNETLGSINGFSLEIMILTAVATIPLELAGMFIVPLLIFTSIMTVLTIVVSFVLTKWFCKDQWFEKALMIFGAGMGTAGIGLMLARSVDPHNESDAAEAIGLWAGISTPLKFFSVIFPTLIVTAGGGTIISLLIAFTMGVIPIIIGVLWFGKGKSLRKVLDFSDADSAQRQTIDAKNSKR